MSELQAGRELDARIATDVMGWTEVHLDVDPNGAIDFWTGKAPENRWFNGIDWFSTDIAAAFEVVEKMRPDGAWEIEDYRSGRRRWHVTYRHFTLGDGEAESDSLPEAICRAALMAVSQNQPEVEVK